MLVIFLVTAVSIAGCTQACALIDGISADFLSADHGYDSEKIIEKTLKVGMSNVLFFINLFCPIENIISYQFYN